MTIARNMTLFVLVSSLTMFAAAVGCGERTGAPEPGAALPASAGEQASADGEAAGKTEATPAPEPTVAEPAPAEPEPAPEPEGPELNARDGLSLQRLVTARDVVDREPVGATSRFEAAPERLYAFVEASSTRDEESVLVVTFQRPDGRSVGHVELTVPAHVPRWRTWAYSRLVDEPGEWHAVVRTTEGEVLGRTRFHVE